MLDAYNTLSMLNHSGSSSAVHNQACALGPPRSLPHTMPRLPTPSTMKCHRHRTSGKWVYDLVQIKQRSGSEATSDYMLSRPTLRPRCIFGILSSSQGIMRCCGLSFRGARRA